jgi:hypothetical protein
VALLPHGVDCVHFGVSSVFVHWSFATRAVGSSYFVFSFIRLVFHSASMCLMFTSPFSSFLFASIVFPLALHRVFRPFSVRTFILSFIAPRCASCLFPRFFLVSAGFPHTLHAGSLHGTDADIIVQEIESLIVQLLLDNYLGENYQSTAYSTISYIRPGPRSIGFTRLSIDGVISSPPTKIMFTFRKEDGGTGRGRGKGKKTAGEGASGSGAKRKRKDVVEEEGDEEIELGEASGSGSGRKRVKEIPLYDDDSDEGLEAEVEEVDDEDADIDMPLIPPPVPRARSRTMAAGSRASSIAKGKGKAKAVRDDDFDPLPSGDSSSIEDFNGEDDGWSHSLRPSATTTKRTLPPLRKPPAKKPAARTKSADVPMDVIVLTDSD